MNRISFICLVVCLFAAWATAAETFAPAPKHVQQTLDEWVQSERIGGAVLVVSREDESPYAATVGSLDGKRPMMQDAVFRIYSMTKPIICAAALTFVEEGRLELSAPISRYLPEFNDIKVLRNSQGPLNEFEALNRQPTIRDLMTHTSGITSASLGEGDLEQAYAEQGVHGRRSPGGLAAMVARLALLPLLHQPGQTWTYGESTTVLGRVLEVVAGQSLDEILRLRVFEPLEMRDTGFYVTEDQQERFTAMYWAEKEGPLAPVFKEPLDAPPFTEPAFTDAPPTLSGGGGLVSTAADYLRFARALLSPAEGAKILDRESIATMTRPDLTKRERAAPYLNRYFPGSSFGLCVAVVTDPAARNRPGSVGTFSWSGFGSTHFWVDPEQALIGIFMTQLRPSFSRLSPVEIEAVVYSQ